MVIISKTKIICFYEPEVKAKDTLLRWYNEVLLCDWQDFHSIKRTFKSVDSIGKNRFVFNVAENKYRIVAMLHFSKRTIYIRFVGTHKQYDSIDCKTI